MKKLPNELSDEELLASLKQEGSVDQKIKPSFNDPILSFLQAFNVTPGKRLVRDTLLHRIFKLWFSESFIEKRNFNLQTGVYIPSKMIGGKRYYLVQDSVFNLARQYETLVENTTITKTKSKRWQRVFNDFLEANNIKEGNLYVEGDILYYIYNRWLDENRRKATFSEENFIQMLKLHFETKRLSDSRIAWFGVNESIKKLITKEEVERWRQGRIYAKKRKKEDPEKVWAKPTSRQALYYKKNKKKSK